MRSLALAAALLTAAPAFACYNGMSEADQKKSEADKLVAKAAGKLDAKDFTGALKEATAALEHKSAQPTARREARRLVAKARLKLGHYAEARAAFQKCLEEAAHPDDPSLLSRLGEAEVGLGLMTEARQRLEALAERDLLPDADAHLALARARAAAGDTVGAYAALAAALEQEPGHAPSLAFKKHLDAKGSGKTNGAPRT